MKGRSDWPSFSEVGEFLLDEKSANTRGKMRGDSGSRSMCAVGRAKGVIHISIRQLGQFGGKSRIIVGFACMETNVFK